METQEVPLTRLEAGISRLMEALHAARRERDAARAEVQTLRSGGEEELTRLHALVDRQERELAALRRQRRLVGEHLHALQGRLDHALAEEPPAGASASPPDPSTPRPAAVEELTLQ